MKNVNRYWLILVFLLPILGLGQSTSEKLKKEQEQLEKNISNTKLLLSKSKLNTEASFNELKLINNQIRYREDLLRNYDNQIRGAELSIQQKQVQIEELSERIVRLKEQYKKLLIYAYKHRNKYGNMMFIFSSTSYFQAIKRAKYLAKIQELMKKQFTIIAQHKNLIGSEVAAIEKEKQYKSGILIEKQQERELILKDKVLKEQLYIDFKNQENAVLAKLREEERQRAELKAKVDAAIRKEILEAEAKRKKAEEELAKKNQGPENKTANSNSNSEPKVFLPETKEAAALGKSFESNRGGLPWPVDKGSVTEGFGKNPHPTLPNVFTNNNGVDISAPKNAQVRCVFEGEVTTVMNIAGAGKVVIVKHGNYRTVYSGLQSVFVKQGSKISTKQVIGSLVSKDGQNTSILHFEIHQVVGTNVNSLNPSLWIAK